MDARALLQGMGWKEGQGLGKSNQGISQAIKPKVQLDRNGLGLNPAASIVEPWWAKVFNQTAKNVSVEEVGRGASNMEKKKKKKKHRHASTDEDVEPQEKSEEPVRKRKKKEKKAKQDEESQPNDTSPSEHQQSNSFNSHIASVSKSLYFGNFTKGKTLCPGDCFSKSEREPETLQKIDSKTPLFNPIDDELWRSCKGRTAHKGARYGVLKGKMARLVRQEQAMAAKFCDNST